MNTNDIIISTIRTVVPALVGILIGQAARVGIDIDSQALTAVLTSVLVGVYYIVVRALGNKDPRFEWLLGSPKTPTYSDPNAG